MMTYMFGSQIRHYSDGHVHFYNPLITSGTDIQRWLSLQNYQATRSQPSLPLLKKGETYRLYAKMETQPADSVFLKVIFLNRYNQKIDQIIAKSSELTFTYPEEAYSYEVSLLSAGLVEMDFWYLTIEKTGGNSDETL